jgi:hypothetical protein
MERVTIDRITAMDIATRTMKDMPVWRVRLDNVPVGLIMERDPVAGRVAFQQVNLTDEEKELVCEFVANKLGVKESSYTVAPIIKDEKTEELPDYGDF